jgi:hypothetical protein
VVEPSADVKRGRPFGFVIAEVKANAPKSTMPMKEETDNLIPVSEVESTGVSQDRMAALGGSRSFCDGLAARAVESHGQRDLLIIMDARFSSHGV